MKKEGHLVGNHTSTHPRLGECNADKIRSELKSVEKCMKKKTGYKLDKFVRPPEGNYSELALKTMQDMGYTTGVLPGMTTILLTSLPQIMLSEDLRVIITKE